MNGHINHNERPKYLNPYFGGVLLGLVVFLTFYITGRGPGASGSVKSAVVAVEDFVAPSHVESNAYFSRFLSPDHSPLYTWLVFESVGVFFGGLLSGVVFGRVKKFRVEHNPKISKRTRNIAALVGGTLFGFGTQFGRGCTSGAALAGTASYSFGGLIVMLAIFAAGYAVAWFFRKLWT